MGPSERLAALGRSRWAYVLASLVVLAPCYWQPRLQAGDLSSHLYNAWLAQLIESGRAEGLILVRQTTNILFDLLLSSLFRIFGAEGAQRLAVSLAVLTFVWGAFAFVSRVAGRKAWHLLPCLAMLAYGWVFHMGFFNFYLSFGICFWALTVAWDLTPKRLLFSVPLFAVAYLAHALPVMWTIGLLAYLWLARRMSGKQRAGLTGIFVTALIVMHMMLVRVVVTRWSPMQVIKSTGLDQVFVFDAKYYVVLIGLLVLWGVLFLALVRVSGARQVMGSLPFQLCVISAAAVFVLPGTVLIPGFSHTLAYIAERMSLGVAVCVCALLGAARPRLVERYALLTVALVYFCFVYKDERALNAFEDRMQDVVSAVPPGQRVVCPIDVDNPRINPVSHMIDRICVGRCYSYANYEPSTAQFRVRAVKHNPIVAETYKEAWHLQIGDWVVQDADLPIYCVSMDPKGRMMVKTLQAKALCGKSAWRVFDDPLPNS